MNLNFQYYDIVPKIQVKVLLKYSFGGKKKLKTLKL